MEVRAQQVTPESIAITGFRQLAQVGKLPPYIKATKKREQLAHGLE
jgi:hypothetical protein